MAGRGCAGATAELVGLGLYVERFVDLPGGGKLGRAGRELGATLDERRGIFMRLVHASNYT
jgi:hypothetical protein